LIFESNHCQHHCIKKGGSNYVLGLKPEAKHLGPISIKAVTAKEFCRHAQRKGHRIFAVSIKDVERALAPKEEVDVESLLP